MNTIKTICISLIALLTLYSCGNDEPITSYRGKVKFETISISSKLAGRIEKIYIEEGQNVKKGDTLAYIDIPEVSAKLTQADGAIKAAQGQLDMAFNGATKDQLNQINGQLNSGNAQLEFAKESYQRMQAMYKDSLISQQQFDEVKMKLNMAQAQVDALEAKRNEAINGARIEQINQAKGQLDRAMGVKDEVISASNEKYVIAPTDMSVETISLKEGELLSPGYTLINGYKTNSVYFRFTVPESKVYDFKVDMPLKLVNPYTKEEVDAKIVAIKQLAQYADITSTAPLYELSESIYELKVVPTEKTSDHVFYLNATILIK
ncbi:HlyD family secretion protein [Bizionia paragorgiae]|jgi:HlyD family secretion protein|uniref:HlyD family secretion protein n=1 Tax=Bizionia paragorgiae TaxID=283786 RepID=A0A1H4C507_BIZPA|nr:biotin/lipoyl-binding protein [Bizionia paragorgiae]MDX1272348.1 biotin/lipoyl-binding protein [Bizionia paragorgiae]SEA55535.1 HlyD family secretion protein [Bizionia paragorgiae]